MGRLKSPLLVHIDGWEQKEEKRNYRKRGYIVGVPRELWVCITQYCEVDDLLRLTSVNKLLSRIGVQLLSDQYPNVVPSLPCRLEIMRGDVRWEVRICRTAIAIKRAGLLHTHISAGVTWVAKLLDWVEGMASAGQISPARGAWAPILATASLDLHPSDAIPHLPPCSLSESSAFGRQQPTMSLLGPFHPNISDSEYEPHEHQIVLDPRKTSFMKMRNMLDLCDEIICENIPMNGLNIHIIPSSTPSAEEAVDEAVEPPPR
eukprot:TRINITY_DN9479_c0_g1_i1.p1 TRINITY_DN9479_c0_g1~~TRINITY_DN9479_c0_g1_i1.p1  ORF type:complete len:261 (+),score=34.26 TRINITY_DN9479_c0_g1_i1:12-794(+)